MPCDKWQTSHYDRRRQWINNIKNVPCIDCGGIFPPECMDFHHRDPKQKVMSIGQNIKLGLSRLIAEIEKCDIICANCHRIRSKASAV